MSDQQPVDSPPPEPQLAPEAGPMEALEPPHDPAPAMTQEEHRPHPVEASPLPVAASIGVDEKAYAQYQALAKTVLDSAEVASRAAESALAGGHDLRQATAQFRELSDNGFKKAKLLLAITAGFMLVCLMFFLIMGVRMVSRVHQLDAILSSATERVAEMQVGLQTLDKLNSGLGELSQRQVDLTKSQAAIEARIDSALKQTEALTQKVPSETAKQVASKSDTMMRQVQSVGTGLQAQSKAVQDLSKEVQSLKSGLGQVDGLKRDVEALVTLQRERYLEALQKNQAASKGNADKILQYPRPSSTPTGSAP